MQLQQYLYENYNLGLRIILVLGCSNDQQISIISRLPSKLGMQDQRAELLVMVQRVHIFNNRLQAGILIMLIMVLLLLSTSLEFLSRLSLKLQYQLDRIQAKLQQKIRGLSRVNNQKLKDVLLCLDIQRNELQVRMILNILSLLFYFSILRQQSERSAFLFQFEKDLLLLRFPAHLSIEFS